MYINENYSNYKYLVECHDNFVVLSTSSSISGTSGDTDSVPAIANYFNGYVLPFTFYSNNTFRFTNIQDSLSHNLEDRSDFPLIYICGFFTIFVLVFIINQFTKFVKKGGVFGFL